MNIISADTKISALIKMNPAAIDAIATINPNCKKLQNPILRKLLASRVTIAEAARMGKCDVSVLFGQLTPLGFTIEDNQPSQGKPEVSPKTTEKHYSARVDVREDIKAGRDPFNRIMKAVREINEGDTILLVNSFEPVPLIKILRARGYNIEITTLDPEEIHTYISKDNSILPQEDIEIGSPEFFEEKQAQFYGRLSRIDVRSLPMPQPMIMILKELETLKKGMALFVDHKKIPRFLLPELRERHYNLVHREVQDGVQLIIYKDEALG